MSNLLSSVFRIPWVFFDLDDTIWNFSANSTVALKLLYEISPILRKYFKNPQEFYDIYHRHNAMLWEMYSRGEVSTSELKVERWRRTLATYQFEVLTAVCEELDRNYLDILAQSQEKVEGCEDLLKKLSEKAIIGVISNGFRATQYKKLSYSGLDRFVGRTVVSEEIGINKPNKSLFDYAIKETGALAPHLYVGDHRDTDILGALKAGWYAIWVNDKKQEEISEEILKSERIDTERYLGSVESLKETYSLIERYLELWNESQLRNQHP